MRAVVIYILEVIACSGVLAALYSLIIERKVDFLFARLFLIFSVLLSAVIPMINIPVWEAALVPQLTEVTVGEVSTEVVQSTVTSFDFNFMALIWAVYGVGVALCMGSMVLQMVNILNIRRVGQMTTFDGVNIVRSQQNIASFSLFKTIYIGNNTADIDLPTIVAHERSHIAHKHSVERVVMEIFKALLWWNPFVWIASRRLVEAHEFEADNDVIGSGCDANLYVATLLKHLFGYSPEIANGLHNSLTKKRLKMILKGNSGRYALLRKVAVIPVLGVLFALFSLTTKEAVAQDVQQSKVEVEVTEINDYQDFYRWVVMNVQYPSAAREQSLSGSVIASLTIDTDGNVKDVKIVKSDNELFSKEVCRVLAKAPAWRPFVKDGKRVDVKYMLPVNFVLDDAKVENVGGVVVKSYK
ncbi:MAG: M56 family metallopeptidase [Alistipes sp.]|nr:M56 family metallopeptidase [Alistipes sp.]